VQKQALLPLMAEHVNNTNNYNNSILNPLAATVVASWRFQPLLSTADQ
jgi:hypothetical protein